MKMSCRWTAGPKETTMQRKRQGRGPLRRTFMQGLWPLTFNKTPCISDITCINSLSARVHWWLYSQWCLSISSDSELISLLFLSPPTSRLSRGSWIRASRASNCCGTSQLAAVSFARNLYHLCPCHCLYVNLQGHWALRSNANESHPNLQLSANRSGCFIFKSLSTLCQPNS